MAGDCDIMGRFWMMVGISCKTFNVLMLREKRENQVEVKGAQSTG